MTGRRHLGFVAAAATLLAAAPLSAIFERWTWLLESLMAVALIAAAATLLRALRAPVWGQLLGMLGTLLLALTWMFPSDHEFMGLVTTPSTVAHFGELLQQSVQDMRSFGIPVPDSEPLLFLTVLGVGSVAVITDLCTVGLRRPALAGLPMLAIYSVPVAVYTDSVPWLPFVVGAAAFLWLLVADNVERVRRFGRRFTGDGRDVDVWEPSPLAAAGRRLAVLGVALAVVLPITVPGMTTGLLTNFRTSGQGNGFPGQGNGSGRVNLFAALSGQLNQAEVTKLAKVTTNEPNPFYLRFGVADDIRRDGFAVRAPKGTAVTRALPDPREQQRNGVTQGFYRASVEITNGFNMQLLPTYAEPVSTKSLDSSWLYDPDMQIVYSNRSLSKGKKYSFEYVRSQFDPLALRAAAALPSDDPVRNRFTAVPSVRYVQEIVRGLITNKNTEYDKVRAIYDFFSVKNKFAYSLRTEGGTSGQDIVNFLTNRVGFCQQYAAAMAWMVRTAGIPARVAFGFTNGSDRDGNTYTLTNLNLHAWTEVYFNGIGWVPFDPTPAASVPGSSRWDWAPNVDAPDPVTPSASTSAGAGAAASGATGGSDRAAKDHGANLPEGPGGPQPSRASWPLWTVAGVALLIALMGVPGLRRSVLRRRRHAAAATAAPAEATAGVGGDLPPGVARVLVTGAAAERIRADAHAAWDELIDTLVDFRVPVDPAETPRATAERVAADGLARGPAADGVRLLGRAEERARYAPAPLPGANLGEALRVVRGDLAARATWRTRLVAAVLPPSVLQRWRMGLMDWYGRFIGTAGRWRDTMMRWNPRRLLAGRAVR
jgi:transglutaminase-like putative cysteine protease